MPTNELQIALNQLVSPEYGQPNTIPDDNPPQDYRYTFNGKESDNNVKGVGNQQDYGMRIYDSRLGRFLSVDPLTKKYLKLTPFQFASNSPIWGIDLDDAELRIHTEITGMTGHAFLTVGTGKETIVYAYGRYASVNKTSGISSGALSLLGSDVLSKLTGDKAVKFVNDQLTINHSKIFEIRDADGKAGRNSVKDVTQQVKVENEIVIHVKLSTTAPATDHPEDTKWKKNVTQPVPATSSTQTNKTN
ncbi:MAG: hypothetical protein J0I41_20340 [Filimonas sp.]|nr:hypothetical protein [Filimonas sp.]